MWHGMIINFRTTAWITEIKLINNFKRKNPRYWQTFTKHKVWEGRRVAKANRLPVHRKRNIQKITAYIFFTELNEDKRASFGLSVIPDTPDREKHFKEAEYDPARIKKAAQNPLNYVLHWLYGNFDEKENPELFLSAQDRSKFARELHYAWLCQVSPDHLLGFIWMECGTKDFKRKYLNLIKRLKKKKAKIQKKQEDYAKHREIFSLDSTDEDLDEGLDEVLDEDWD